jgi:hypothetical protein
MTYTQFLILLCVFALNGLLSNLVGEFVPLPDSAKAVKMDWKKYLKNKSKVYLAIFMFVNVFIVLTWFIGFIGMAFLWHLAPWIFACAEASSLIFSQLVAPLVIETVWKIALSGMQMLLTGVILTLIFFGPAGHCFLTPE